MKKKNKLHLATQLNTDISYSKNIFQKLNMENAIPKS